MRGAHAQRAALLMLSCWLAQGASAGEGTSALVARADSKLYEAKQAGRNRVAA